MREALRFPVGFALAVGINLLLFIVIITLVTGERTRLKRTGEDITVVDFIRLVREIEAPARRRETLPEPPAEVIKPPPPPKQPLQEVKPPEQPPMRLLTPELAPPLHISDAPELPAVAPPMQELPVSSDAPVAVQETPTAPVMAPPAPGPTTGEPQFDSAPQAVYKPDPKYPPRALRAGIEGTVTVEFIITPEGGVRDVVVVDAKPPGVFDDATKQGVMKWKFQPKMVDGQPIARKARIDVKFVLRKG
jgi:protein TonB